MTCTGNAATESGGAISSKENCSTTFDTDSTVTFNNKVMLDELL